MGHRRDEAEPLARFLDNGVAGRTAGRIVGIAQCPFALQPCPDQRQRQVLVRAVAVDVAKRHGLDQAEVEAL